MSSEFSRKTTETDIKLNLQIYGEGKYKINSGIGFFNHMLELFAKHGQFNLELNCVGDLDVDGHHTVEDCGILLGKAFATASKEKIKRYATKFVPMDEALVMVNTDVSGRGFLVFNVDLPNVTVGSFDAQLCEEFFRALALNAGITLHINLQYGKNTHHIIEGIFKAVAHSLREAYTIDDSLKGVLSTKGVL